MIKTQLSKKFFIITFILTILIYAFTLNFGLSDAMDKKIYDIFSNIKVEKEIKSINSVIVKIDEKSLKALGQWPWSRLVITKLIQNIQKTRPASIGLDVIFSEKDRTSPKILNSFYKENLGIDVNLSSIPKTLWDNDKILSHTLAKPNVATSIIASITPINPECNPKNSILSKGDFSSFYEANFFTCNTPLIQENLTNSGFINAHVSKDGLLRNYGLAYKYKNRLIPSLGVSMLKSVDKNILVKNNHNPLSPFEFNFLDHKIYSNEKGEVLNYLHKPARFKSISVIDVLKGNFDPSLFTGKFILIGTTAVGLSDFYSTVDGDRITGIYSHASFIQNALHDTLSYSPNIAKYIACAISFLFTIFILIFLQNYLLTTVSCFTVTLALGFATYALLSLGFYFPFGYFITPLFISYFFILTLVSYMSQKNEKELNHKIMQIRSSIINNMMTMIETRDTETGNHILRTKEFAKAIAQYLASNNKKFSSYLTPQTINHIYHAAPLHDIGKIGIPDKILQKPDRLEKDEMVTMRTHAKIGYNILANSQKIDFESSFYKIASNIIYTHHEKWDGSGYPQGLKGENIPLEGRIIALCDVYDALTSKRYYKEAYNFEKAKRIIELESGYHFDPDLVDAFLKLEKEFQKIALLYKD